MLKLVDLNGSWTLSVSKEGLPLKSLEASRRAGLTTIPANVPGNFELDLQAAGLLPEPFFGTNMKKVNELEDRHVYYSKFFDAAPEDGFEPFLLFEGLDAFADVFLNGELVASCDNMLIPQEIPLAGRLRSGSNELFVHIRPAVLEALKYDYPPCMAHNIWQEANHVRKAPHSYGWDIMPRAVSAGIWRPVRIELRPRVRIEDAFLVTQSLAQDKSEAVLKLFCSATAEPVPFGRYEVEVEGVCGSSRFSRRAFVHCPKSIRLADIKLSDPKLWSPRGHGAPNLYDVRVRLLRDGVEVDARSFRHGVRVVELKRSSVTDELGSGEFVFLVNHERVFMKGSNWVPLDAFHSRDNLRLERAMELVADLDCNILRCWGGNVYESDRFFELCDELGVCVWQDFAMACAIYPQTDDFKSRLEREARAVVRRLRNHPSLILWAGDNECDEAFSWFKTGDPNRNVLTREVLPKVVWAEDPSRPFLPSSPYVDREAWKKGPAYAPERHLWGPRDSFKSDFYKRSLAHFASEIGYHGCPAPESLAKFLSKDSLWPWKGNEEWRLHSSCPTPDMFGPDPDSRNALMARQIKELFGVTPDDLESFSFASQCVQAEALKFFIELFRSAMWRRTGIIWWNLLDGWPQISDAVVDYYFERKRAYDFIKRSQRGICLMFKEPDSWRQELVASNLTLDSSSLSYSVRDVETGATLLSGSRSLAPSSATALGSIPFSQGDKKLYLIEWEDKFGHGVNHYLAGLPPFSLEWYEKTLGGAGLLKKRKA